jgi:hypothetical protein
MLTAARSPAVTVVTLLLFAEGLAYRLSVDNLLPFLVFPDRPFPLHDAEEAERDARSASQWIESVRAYLRWRAGESWRPVTQRYALGRWYYLDGLRALDGAQRETSGLSARDLFPEHYPKRPASARTQQAGERAPRLLTPRSAAKRVRGRA